MISAILHWGRLSKTPVWWFTLTAGILVEAGLGFILGYGWMNHYILSKNPETKEKANQTREKILPWQKKLAILGLIVGFWMIIASFIIVVG